MLKVLCCCSDFFYLFFCFVDVVFVFILLSLRFFFFFEIYAFFHHNHDGCYPLEQFYFCGILARVGFLGVGVWRFLLFFLAAMHLNVRKFVCFYFSERKFLDALLRLRTSFSAVHKDAFWRGVVTSS